EQKKAFDEAYYAMIKGMISWKDFVPPTTLPAAGTKMMMLSLKALVGLGDKGMTALDVASVHDMLGYSSPGDIFATYGITKFKRPSSGLEELQVFCVILTLERVVYGKDSTWK
ncbi:MAG TPA: hypothetical protein PKJ41_08855, partial [Bryobacteraceae bacterium]|nr:hypothetical protein [Bryobacteraceae bacterium]